VYFPLDSVFSTVAEVDQRAIIEVATTAIEGMVGLPVFVGAASSPHSAFSQVPGLAARLGADDLHRLLVHDCALHLQLNRCVQATMVQIAQNVVCNTRSKQHRQRRATRREVGVDHPRPHRTEFDALTKPEGPGPRPGCGGDAPGPWRVS
jgi:hypothetical protein